MPLQGRTPSTQHIFTIETKGVPTTGASKQKSPLPMPVLVTISAVLSLSAAITLSSELGAMMTLQARLIFLNEQTQIGVKLTSLLPQMAICPTPLATPSPSIATMYL
jgi:hypothetical protein